MKRVLALSVLALSVAACDGSRTSNAALAEAAKPKQPAAASIDKTASARPEPATTTSPGTLINLPQNIRFDFPYTLRAQRTATSPKGEPRRWTGLEYTTGDQRAALSTIQVAMASAGFSAEEESRTANGGLRQMFLKKGYGRVLVTVFDGNGQKFINPNAKGVIWLDFPGN